MSLATYGDLKAAVANWLARTDLAARIPEFVALAEADISRKLRRETLYTTVSMTGNPLTLASPGVVESLRMIRYATSTGDPFPIQITTLAGLGDQRRTGSGRPRYAALGDANTVYFEVDPDGTYSMVVWYWLALSTLIGVDGNTNTTLTNAPDIYLYGTLLHSAPYLEHDDRLPLWRDLYESAIQDENNARERAELGAAPMNMGLPVVF